MEVVERRFTVMASEAHVIVVGAAGELARRAEEQLRHLERRWSRFLPDSDVTRLNTAGGRPIAVDPDTLTLLGSMIDAWRMTGGRFDPTVLPVLVDSGYHSSTTDSQAVTRLPGGPFRLGDLDAIDVDVERGTVTLPPGVVVDPGGIGKGLAADLAVAQLLASGARGALVGIGGDLAMAGQPPLDEAWQVNVERPVATDGQLCALAVSGGGVATSSTRSRRWSHAGRVHHHVVDPFTASQSDTDLETVTVVARSGWLAEAHATAAAVAGSLAAVRYLEAHGLTGLATTRDGRILATHDIRDALLLGEAHR